MKDLLVLTADASIRAGVEGLLARPEALGIRRVDAEVVPHPQRDPACYGKPVEFLRTRRGEFRHALVVFDAAWDGAPRRNGLDLEADVRGRFAEADMTDWADVVVLDPELEVWVWSDSPQVDECIGWRARNHVLRAWLGQEGLWTEGAAKPSDPKRALDRALEAVGQPRSASTFRALAQKVSVDRCSDPSFNRFRMRLRSWFGASLE